MTDVDAHLLFGLCPYEGSDDEDECCIICQKASRLEHVIKNPLLHEDFENSHIDDCTCTECKKHGPERYECLLCDRDDMTKQAVEYHCGEDTHTSNAQVLKREQHDTMGFVQRWNELHRTLACQRLKEADRLTLPDDVLAAAYRFAAAKSKHTIGKVIRLMQKYEFGERLALLWLAVWKASVCRKCRSFPTILHRKNGFRQDGRAARPEKENPRLWS
jgi:hypothetical protein